MERDEQRYKIELASKEETRESIVAKMKHRAQELKDKRETARKILVKEKLDQRFRYFISNSF